VTAAEALAPETDLIAQLDPADFGGRTQPDDPSPVAGSHAKTRRLMVAGLGRLGRRTRRPLHPATADGQRPLSRTRRGARRLRPRL